MENNDENPTVGYLYKLVADLIQEGEERKKPKRKLRYIIYARKSTDDTEHQVKSIPEQLSDIDRFLKDKDWDVCKTPIIEKESAKFSGIRPLFKKMLKDIEDGIYDGVISWHPDRLARNMMEAGKIIDMLDKNIMHDLKFSDFSFENTSSGKLSLGIAFVMSKQYTDHLTEQINRGNAFHVARGSGIGRDKHGYFRDKRNFHRPDGINFELIKEAWKMRIEGDGKNLLEIANYLNSKNYSKAKGIDGKTHVTCKMTDKILSVLFKDTFYAGVLKIGKNIANITEQYDFVPAVSPADFLYLNDRIGLKSFVAKRGMKKDNVKGCFLRKTVICSSCHKFMTTAVTPKYVGKDHKLKKMYYNFRCKTPGCKRIKKNVRGFVVMNQIVDFFEKNLIATPEYYKSYVEEMERLRREKKKELDSKKTSLTQEDRHIQADIEDLKRLMAGLAKGGDSNKSSIEEFNQTLKVKLSRINANDEEKKRIDIELNSTQKAVLSYGEFVELLKKYPKELIKLKTLSKKSDYIKKILANCVLDELKVVFYRLNPPFDKLVPSENLVVSSGFP